MTNQNPDQYTVKEILSQLVIPRLDKIEAGIQAKADQDAVDKVAAALQLKADREDVLSMQGDLRVLKETALTVAQVEKQFGELFQSRKSRGWKTWERVLLISTLVGSLLSILSVIFVAAKVVGGP